MFFSPTSWEAPLVSSVSELTTSPRLEIMLEDAFYQVKPSEPQWPEWPQNGKGISQQAVVTGFFCGNISLKAHIYIHVYTYIYIYIYIYCIYIYRVLFYLHINEAAALLESDCIQFSEILRPEGKRKQKKSKDKTS